MDKSTYISIVKGAMLFTAGAVAGALVANGILRAKYEKLSEEEIASVKAAYQVRAQKIGNFSKSESEKTANVMSQEELDSMEEAKNYESTLAELGYTVTPKDIARLNDNLKRGIVPVEPDDEEEDVDDEDSDEPEEEDSEVVNVFEASKDGTPYIITWEQFSEENEHYEKVNLDYYAYDDTLSDTNDAPIPDVIGLIGRDALDNFGNGSHEENVVYVRNDKLALDFEIVRKDTSYSAYVLGNIEEKPRIGRMRENYDG